jgi:hypothetical protein
MFFFGCVIFTLSGRPATKKHERAAGPLVLKSALIDALTTQRRNSLLVHWFHNLE